MFNSNPYIYLFYTPKIYESNKPKNYIQKKTQQQQQHNLFLF